MRAPIDSQTVVVAPQKPGGTLLVLAAAIPAKLFATDASHVRAALDPLDHLVTVRALFGLPGKIKGVEALLQRHHGLVPEFQVELLVLRTKEKALGAGVTLQKGGHAAARGSPEDTGAGGVLASEDPVVRLCVLERRIRQDLLHTTLREHLGGH